MKLKYLFPLLIAAVAFLASCEEENAVTLLEEIQVSSSFVSIPVKGGSTTITVNAKESWKVEKVIVKKDSVKWLDISSMTGSAGETELTFKADSTIDGRMAEVLLMLESDTTITQRISIIQGVIKVSDAKVKEVNVGPDGKTFRVTGVCTSIVNTVYGNWYITDDTGSLYIYGTLDEKGATKNFLSLGLEVGDEVTVEGPKATYAGSAQLVNVSVIKINKSLVKVDSVENEVLPVKGGEFIAHLTCKGQGVSVEIPENAKSWLSISSIQSAGTNTVVKFKASANTGGDRGTTITFSTTDGTKKYTTETTLSQKGEIVKATIAEFLAAAVGDTQYRLTGVITNITDAAKGRLYLKDFSGEAYVYGVQDFQSKGLKVGDIITVAGKRAAYNNSPQMGGAVLESSVSVIPISIADVLAKPKSDEIYYMVTGEITEIKNEAYGNLNLKDESGEIYLYGCYPGYGAVGDDRKGLIAAKGLKVGDKLTVIALKDIYNDAHQLAKGIYVSHVSAQ